jgi:hypothetical protein
MNDLAIASFEQAFFEYRANFKEPVAALWLGARQGEIITSLQKALLPWNVGLENVSLNASAKNVAELLWTFEIRSMSAVIQVGIGGVTINAFDPDWSRERDFVSLFQTAVDTLKVTAETNFQSQQTTFAFHVKPGLKPFRDIVGQFVNAKNLGAEDAVMFGVSVYHNDFLFVIDGSAVFPNSAFVKITRIFPGAARFDEMASAGYKDEEAVLSRLGLKPR